ncbi:MAG TPA: DUF885 domain-containing protein [Streptosporangiaceae bacterium]|nr:DUF885 domain-containing protein [Streptosporangiaceae bacterium]
MTQNTASAGDGADNRAVRTAADDFVSRTAELNPLLATTLGLPDGQDELPDLSPAGQDAIDELQRAMLGRLDGLEQAAGPAGFADADERRCARLLRERLETDLAIRAGGEHLRAISNIFGPPQQVRGIFLLMPAATSDDWAVISRRIGRVPDALAGYRKSLAEGSVRGLHAAPRQVETVAGQLAQWLTAGEGRGWFTGFTAGTPADAPVSLRTELDAASAAADAAVAGLRDWLLTEYLPAAAGTPDGVGTERYLAGGRRWNGSALDLAEVYDWGWSQYRQIMADMRAEADRILPGSTPREAMRHLDSHGEVVDGVEAVRARLQQMMDDAMASLSGVHFDLADPIKVVEARIAPPGSAAAPYYTAPSQDFARPGRTWLPTLGKTTFPMWHLISTWYHEGVPGHHLQIAQWRYLAAQLSVYQTSLGQVSACSEGWALYAERLMDELGFLDGPGARLGYLDAQLMRAIRVIVDIGMHVRLPAEADWAPGAGQAWTPELALEFFDSHSGRGRDFAESEIVRYLGAPGQAISYKLGERAWLAGRDAAKAARGADFDLKSWHMAALSLGSLGLDDLADELAQL